MSEKKFNILISLDGDFKGSSLRIDKHGNSSFYNILSNIDLIYNKYHEYFKTYVNFNSVISKMNSISDSFNFIKGRYGKIPQISTINPLGVSDNKKEIFNSLYASIDDNISNNDLNKLKSNMSILAPGAISFTKFIRKYSNSFYKNNTDLMFSSKQKISPTGTCPPFSRKIFITVNGKILPCERIGQNYNFGICTTEDVIINKKYIANLYNNYYLESGKFCKNCYNNEDCTECFFYICNSEKKINCNSYTTREKFISGLTKNIEICESNIYNYRDIINNYKII